MSTAFAVRLLVRTLLLACLIPNVVLAFVPAAASRRLG